MRADHITVAYLHPISTAADRLEDGRIAGAWAESDNLAGLRRLGHIPSPGSS